MIITAKHSNVYYICEKEKGFKAVEKAKKCKNDFNLDLFLYNGNVFEGRSGVSMLSESNLSRLAEIIERNGGLQRIQELIEANVALLGESPRYTRPDERKQDIFPPDPEKENTVYAKDSYGKKHYYLRISNENDVELFNRKNLTNDFDTVYVQCEGYMVAIGNNSNIEDIKKRVAGFENGVKGEVERFFNESMANPQKWADFGFANILGRADEAKAHNEPIREAREQANRKRDEEYEARRVAAEQAEKEAYEKAINSAEQAILSKGKVMNTKINGKSLILQLFREHEISVPLKTQGWIIKSLNDIYYSEKHGGWCYHCIGRPSTVIFDYIEKLLAAVQTKQQYEEMNQNPCPYDGDTENDCADCVYTGDYRFQDGECVQRDDDDYEPDDENDMEV